MQVAVAGGKGGTGKTTVATNLALSLAEARLLDCDVEEPNCHLFLDVDLNPAGTVEVSIPVINQEKCDLCGECSRLCNFNALVQLPDEVILQPELCQSCGLCVMACPTGAIAEREEVTGTVEKGTGELDFYHGRLKPGAAHAEPVIKAVKDRISPDDVNILDAPPGCNCAAISALAGVDFCILVTEPTPFGFHDLKKSVEMLEELEIPVGVVVNRAGDQLDQATDEYCRQKNIPVLMRIPEAREIARLYSNGVAFVKQKDEWKQKFRDMFVEIKELIG